MSGKFVPAQGEHSLDRGTQPGWYCRSPLKGIGTALISGILAADSILRSTETGQDAASFYLEGVKPTVEVIRRLCAVQKELDEISSQGPGPLAVAMLAAYRETLTIQTR